MSNMWAYNMNFSPDFNKVSLNGRLNLQIAGLLRSPDELI